MVFDLTDITALFSRFLSTEPSSFQFGLASLNAWVESQLSSTGNGFVLFILLFIGGMLASLLPCVYPLYPITVSIVRKHAEGTRKWLALAAYYWGLCLTYMLLGITAAITGGAFNTILRFGTTNIAIGMILVVLGLATVELLYLPFFTSRNLNTKAGLFGTLLMGMSAGLLSSACVGPVVVSVLINLAALAPEDIYRAAALGGFQMLGFGMGVGVPFLVIGLFGFSIPKAGKWMRWVQYPLGGLIFYFGYLYIEKGLIVFGFSRPAIFALIALSVCIVAFVVLLQKKESPYHIRLQRSLYVLGLVIVVSVFFRTVQDSRTIPASNIPAPDDRSPAIEVDKNLTWYLEEADAYQKAEEEGKKVFIDFHADWCIHCRTFKELTQRNERLNAALQKVVLLKIYDRTPLFRKYANDSRFPELRVGLPFFIITDNKGNVLYKTNDYLRSDIMISFME